MILQMALKFIYTSYIPPLPRAQETLQKRRQKKIRMRRDGGHHLRPLRHSRPGTHMNSRRLWDHAQDLHRITTGRVLELKGEVDPPDF